MEICLRHLMRKVAQTEPPVQQISQYVEYSFLTENLPFHLEFSWISVSGIKMNKRAYVHTYLHRKYNTLSNF